ncbi:MAG: hypothetical protein ACX94C_09405 [Phycisphaerales bacterium]
MQYDETARERAEHIAERSPEGAPANPALGSGSLVLVTLMVPIGVLIAAGVVWAMFGGMAALATLAVGLFISVIANPTLWAILNRAKERG